MPHRRGLAATLCAGLLFSALSCARPIPIVVVALENELLSKPVGSPLSPYAAEKTAFRITIQNIGPAPLTAAAVQTHLPALMMEDFKITEGPMYLAGEEDSWNPALGDALEPGQKAALWIWGHFLSSGEKAVSAKNPYSTVESRLSVLEDPGCADSDLGDDPGTRGWVIGRQYYEGKSDTPSQRWVDQCLGGFSGSILEEYSCQDGYRQPRQIPCANGCRAGACLPKSELSAGAPYAKLAALFAANGLADKARTEWDKCLAVDPENPACRKALAPPPPAPTKTAAPRAAPAPLSSSDKSRRRAMSHWHSGIIYFQKGDYRKAKDEWLLCRKLDPNNVDCAAGLNRIDQAYPGI